MKQLLNFIFCFVSSIFLLDFQTDVVAIGKELTHCESGFCLFLAPGERVGVLNPATPLGNQLNERDSLLSGRIFLKNEYQPIGGIGLEASAVPQNITRTKGDFLRVYLPTMPQSGSVHLRKLWEAVTGVVTERSSIGPGLALSTRTGAFAPACGGIPIDAANESMIVSPTSEQCASIKPGMGNDPVLIKSNEPNEYVGPIFRETADVILLMVRNPVDAYQSLFQQRNAKYMVSQDANDLEWRLTFDQFLSSIWEAYITHFDDVKIPRVVIRYEDMQTHADALIKEVLAFTGYASIRKVNNDVVTDAVKQLQKATTKLRPQNVVGEGFKVLMSLNEEDQRFALQVLNKYNATLKALGYLYYKEKDGFPDSFKPMIKQQEKLEKDRMDALKLVGLKVDSGEIKAKARNNAGGGLNTVPSPQPNSGDNSSTGFNIMFFGMIIFIVTVFLMLNKFNAAKQGQVAVLDRVLNGVSLPSFMKSGVELGSFKSRLNASFAKSSTNSYRDTHGSRIMEEAKSVMSQNTETPAAKLARLKNLRDKLASVRT